MLCIKGNFGCLISRAKFWLNKA